MMMMTKRILSCLLRYSIQTNCWKLSRIVDRNEELELTRRRTQLQSILYTTRITRTTSSHSVLFWCSRQEKANQRDFQNGQEGDTYDFFLHTREEEWVTHIEYLVCKNIDQSIRQKLWQNSLVGLSNYSPSYFSYPNPAWRRAMCKLINPILSAVYWLVTRRN